MKMQEIHQKRAVTQGNKPCHVASNNILKEIARTGPKNIDALNKIVGFANSGLAEEAEQIVEIVAAELEKESS